MIAEKRLAVPKARTAFRLVNRATNRKFDLSRSLTIGRASTNDMIFADDGAVSSRHARITVLAGHVWIEDLASRNGTFVDGLRVEKGRSTEVAVGAVIGIGCQKIQVTEIDVSKPSRSIVTPKVSGAASHDTEVTQETAWLVIGINILIFLWQTFSSGHFGMISTDDLIRQGGNVGFLMKSGDWWRPLTSIFLHADPQHLLSNMALLWYLAGRVSAFYGAIGFMTIYIFSGFAGGILGHFFVPFWVVRVGASGAIFGVIGAVIVALIRDRKMIGGFQNFKFLLALVYFSYTNLGLGAAGVDAAAHVGGLMFGLILGLMLVQFAREDVWVQRAAVAGLIGAIFTLELFTPKVPSRTRGELVRIAASLSAFSGEAFDPFVGLEKRRNRRYTYAISNATAEVATQANLRLKRLTLKKSDDQILAGSLENVVSSLTRLSTNLSDAGAAGDMDRINQIWFDAAELRSRLNSIVETRGMTK